MVDCAGDRVKHVVGLSGGKDSTALAFMLKEREPQTDWTYICTPTGDESPVMVDHWLGLEEALGKPLVRITNPKVPDLDSLIEIQGMLPNFRARFCTRILKIEPTIAYCVKNAPILMHVGLRADEDEREGIYGDLVKSRFPFREWGISLDGVLGYCDYIADQYGIVIPDRTDCLPEVLPPEDRGMVELLARASREVLDGVSAGAGLRPHVSLPRARYMASSAG